MPKSQGTPRAVLLVGVLTLLVPEAETRKRTASGPLRFQDVVSVKGATRDQIYDAALAWFTQKFGSSKDGLEKDKLAGLLVGRGEEEYVPPFMANACRGSLRYRVMLVAKEGRYYYTIDGFTHVGDRACRKRSFGPLTTDWLSATIHKTLLDFTLQPPARQDEDKEAWLDLKKKATAVAEALAASLQGGFTALVPHKPAA